MTEDRLSDHFSESEFVCRCGCEKVYVNPRLITALEAIRARAGGRPIKITSGYRCESHNAAVGGKPNSAHLVGEAADIQAVFSEDKYRIIEAAMHVGILRVGVGRAYVHIDVSRTLPQGVVWLYGSGA